MAPVMHRGAVVFVRAVVAALLLALTASTGWMSPTAHAAPEKNAGVNRFGSCLASEKSGDLLLLFDESGSLTQTDPKAARVQAARYLLQTLGRYADRVQADLSVSVAGFAETYATEHDWTRLTAGSADSLGESLAPLANKNTGIDTDYWLALDGARQALAARGAGRCQAVAWFSDGKIDFTQRPGTKPYAEGISLDSPDGVAETGRRAVDSICRSGGLADQIRSNRIVMLAIGLGADAAPADFDVMSAIATGHGLAGKSCGDITDPVPGDFYPAANIDDMLFAFDALNPDPGVSSQGPVCKLQVCPEARHNFVLDRSIKSVSILGSGGQPGVIPYLVAPGGQAMELPKTNGKINANLGGVPVSYEWQSDSAQAISMKNDGNPLWAGQWAIVYVDISGRHPEAVSKVNIHIVTDIFPALADPKMAWRSGQVLDGVKFMLVDGQGKPVTDLAGTALMSASLVPNGAAPIPLLTSVTGPDISKPVDIDLRDAGPGQATLRMSLTITTAAATDPAGVQIAPGTQLSPQGVEVPVQILPRLGMPTPGERVDFGSVEAAKGVSGTLPITGPGCAWIADSDATKVIAAPDDVGTPRVSASANSAQNCLKVQAGETSNLALTLHTEHDGRGGLSGTIPVHVAPLENTTESQTVDVPFVASLTKPLNTTNFVLVLIAALLLGPGLPLALLYATKWWVSRIPGTVLLAERIPVEVNDGVVARGGEPFAPAETDLVHPVPGLSGGTRKLEVHGVTLAATMGRSPFGTGRVIVTADGRVSVGSKVPGTDRSGARAVLPLAIHNTWVVLHDPRGPASSAEVLILVAGTSDTAAKQKIYDDINQRLPDLLSALRASAVQAGLASAYDGEQPNSPFGQAAGPGAGSGSDPFSAAAPAASAPSSAPFGDPFAGPFGAQPTGPRPPAGASMPSSGPPQQYRPPAGPQFPGPGNRPGGPYAGPPAGPAWQDVPTPAGPPDPYAETREAPLGYQPGAGLAPGHQHPAGPPRGAPPPPDSAPPQRQPSNPGNEPFNPFGEGT